MGHLALAFNTMLGRIQDAFTTRDATEARLRRYPPLVFAGECDELKGRLAAAARGEAFLLQGGDCAETFAEATADRIRNKIKTVLQMAVVLTYGASLPVGTSPCRPTAATRSTTTPSTRSLAPPTRDACYRPTTAAA